MRPQLIQIWTQGMKMSILDKQVCQIYPILISILSFISGHLGGQPSKENKSTLKGEETSKRPSGVFLWLLLVFALMILYLVVHMGFKEGEKMTYQVSRPTPIKDERANGIVKKGISENLYEYFDVKKWP